MIRCLPNRWSNTAAQSPAAKMSGTFVRHVSSTLLPAEGAVFALFLAESADAVVAVNALAGLQVDRVVEGLQVTGPVAARTQIEGPP